MSTVWQLRIYRQMEFVFYEPGFLKDVRVGFLVDHGVLVVNFADMYRRAAGGGLSVSGCGGPSLVMYRARDFAAV
jgi:hypothetical protein